MARKGAPLWLGPGWLRDDTVTSSSCVKLRLTKPRRSAGSNVIEDVGDAASRMGPLSCWCASKRCWSEAPDSQGAQGAAQGPSADGSCPAVAQRGEPGRQHRLQRRERLVELRSRGGDDGRRDPGAATANRAQPRLPSALLPRLDSAPWDDPNARTLCFRLDGKEAGPDAPRYLLFLVLNPDDRTRRGSLPPPPARNQWHHVVDTSLPSPLDHSDPSNPKRPSAVLGSRPFARRPSTPRAGRGVSVVRCESHVTDRCAPLRRTATALRIAAAPASRLWSVPRRSRAETSDSIPDRARARAR